MFFWVGLLTFISTILLYSFFPRNDGIKEIDIPIAKVAVSGLIHQHMAALQAATVMVKDVETGRNRLQYMDWRKTENISNILPLETDKYERYLPRGIDLDAFGAQATVLFCVDNFTGDLTTNCGVTNVSLEGNNPTGTTDFLMTYEGEIDADDYIFNLAPRALGYKMFFTPYEEGVHLQTQCGVVECDDFRRSEYDPSGHCSVNNTRYRTVSLPLAITGEEDDWDGRLVCITRLSAAYTSTVDDKGTTRYQRAVIGQEIEQEGE